MSRYLAIDIDQQALFVVDGSARGGAAKVENALAWADDAMPPLTADTAKAYGERLKEHLKAGGIAPGPVLVAVGRDKVILKELRYPAVPPVQEPAIVKFQAMKELTESPDDVVLDYAPLVNGVANPDAERRSMAVVLRKDVFAAIQTMCTTAGLKLAGVTPRPFAVASGITRAFAAGAVQPPDSADDAVAVLTPAPSGGEFTVLRHGQVSFTRAVPAQVMVSEPQLVNEVRRNLAVYAGQNPTHPVKAVYVAEAESGAVGWAGRLRTTLGVPVYPFDPLAGAAAAGVPPQQRGRFAGAVGLLAGKAADTLSINFASPRAPRADADPNKRKMVFAGLIAAGLLLAAGVWGWVTLSAANTELAELRQKKENLDATLKRMDPDGKRLAAVDDWSKREIVWVDELQDMTDRFAPDDAVRVNYFEGKTLPAGKDGKQPRGQGTIEMRVGTKSPDAVGRVVSAIERENTAAAKFYTATQQRTAGLASGSGGYNQLFTITTDVTRRPPELYTRLPAFITPSRRTSGGTLASTPQPDEKKADPDATDPDPATPGDP